VNQERLKLTWRGSKTSQQLRMFEVFFFKNVGLPAGKTPEQISKDYDECFGRPSAEMVLHFQKSAKIMMSIDDWRPFFECVGVPCPSELSLSQMLRKCLIESFKKEYNGSYNDVMASYPEISDELKLFFASYKSHHN